MKDIILGFNKSLIYDNRYKFILTGLKNTIIISFFSVIFGVIIGTLIACIVEYHKETNKINILSKLSNFYVRIIRGTPILLQLMIMYYVIFKNVKNINIILVCVLAFGINSGAYISQIIKAGINSIDKGQMEAARSLGLNYFQTMRYIILPQAIKNILPAIGNEFIALIKETSVAGYIGIRDLTKASDIIASRTYNYFFPLIISAVIYLIIIIGLEQVLKQFEGKLSNNDRS